MQHVIIFDLDGVILSTDDYHYRAWKDIADREGIPFDRTINNQLRGVSRGESLDIILKQSSRTYSLAEKNRLMEVKNNKYRQLLEQLQEADVTSEVRETLRILKERGYKLAIGSSSKNARFILERVELLTWFDAIADGTDVKRSKPQPDVFLKAAEFLKVSPSNCIVVEDAWAGIEAAKAAGMLAIGIGDAANSEKADIAIEKFGQLLQVQGNEAGHHQ